MQQLNEYAVGVSRDNRDSGLDNATVWCYEPLNVDEEVSYPVLTVVYSLDLLKYGSCRGIITEGTGATNCNRSGEGWVCWIGRE